MSELPDLIETNKAYLPHLFKTPKLDPSVFVADGAKIIGDVEIGKNSSVWFNSVLRADVGFVRIGENTNIQDLSLIHESYQKHPTVIGNSVTVGHSCILHACTIKDFCMVGMGSTILDGAELGEYVLLGAGSLVTQGMKIPSYSKVMGRPAKVVGKISEQEKEMIDWLAQHYVKLGKIYLSTSYSKNAILK